MVYNNFKTFINVKANETPKKIYLHIRPNKEIGSTWHANKISDTDIEYTRTDAFIEKVCVWLKESITNNPECNRIISKKGVITMGELIKDFITYMKEE